VPDQLLMKPGVNATRGEHPRDPKAESAVLRAETGLRHPQPTNDRGAPT
jgi:hypothetical protein